MARTKIVTICQGGNSRSVGCGYLLKYKYGCDTLACGWEGNTPETLRMLCEWADFVIIMQEEFRKYVPEEFHGKLQVVDVGPDIWCNSLHPDLLEVVDAKLQLMMQVKEG
jgi:predicted protein tyrosine phosphatase